MDLPTSSYIPVYLFLSEKQEDKIEQFFGKFVKVEKVVSRPSHPHHAGWGLEGGGAVGVGEDAGGQAGPAGEMGIK